MQGMFRSALVFNSDVSSWNVSRVETMIHDTDVLLRLLF
jgi:surface protein